MTDAEPVVEERQRLAADHAIGCGWRAEEHRLSSDRWARRAVAIAVATAVISAVAGGSLITGAKDNTAVQVIVGILAIAGAGLTAYSTVAGPASKAEAHRRASAAFGVMSTEFWRFARTTHAPESVGDEYADLERRHAAAKNESPLVESWTEEVTKRRRASS